MPFILFLFIATSAFAQTSYLGGSGTLTDTTTKTDLKYFARVDLTKNSRTWHVIQCQMNKKCFYFDLILEHAIDGKWYVDAPKSFTKRRRSQAKVDEDHIKLHSFETSWKGDRGTTVGKMSHLTVNGSTFWKEKEWDEKKVYYEAKLVLNPISKEEYDAGIKDMDIQYPDSLKRQAPKK
ncbi:MAG: hypothetical protein ACJ76H_12790 [Bacteriovoracaceae bacterium]